MSNSVFTDKRRTDSRGHMTRSYEKTRSMVGTAMLGALATVLMFFSFNVPLMPSFIKMDLSELPALIASFAYGPVYGVAVCFIKNIINVFASSTGGVGELSNFILGTLFVFPAGFIYRKMKSRKGALLGALTGAASALRGISRRNGVSLRGGWRVAAMPGWAICAGTWTSGLMWRR